MLRTLSAGWLLAAALSPWLLLPPENPISVVCERHGGIGPTLKQGVCTYPPLNLTEGEATYDIAPMPGYCLETTTLCADESVFVRFAQYAYPTTSFDSADWKFRCSRICRGRGLLHAQYGAVTIGVNRPPPAVCVCVSEDVVTVVEVNRR